MAKLSMKDLEKVLVATLTGMTVEQFNAEVKTWVATAPFPRDLPARVILGAAVLSAPDAGQGGSPRLRQGRSGLYPDGQG